MPAVVKTVNGPAYASEKIWQFLHLWGVDHTFGIPHSPTGQAIVEHAHGTLKHVLDKQKRGMHGETPQSRLAKALYTINHLCIQLITVPQNSNNPVILNHFLSLQSAGDTQLPQAKAWVWNLLTNQSEGPHELIVWGRGYACVSTDTGIRWLPSKCVRPDLRHQRQNRQPPNDDQNTNHPDGNQNVDHQPNDSSDDDQDVNHQADGPSTSRD